MLKSSVALSLVFICSSVVFAEPSSKTKCASIAASAMDLPDRVRAFEVRAGGELVPSDSGSGAVNYSKDKETVTFTKTFSHIPNYSRKYTFHKKNGFIVGAESSITCKPNGPCIDKVALDENCNLESIVDMSGKKITYDRTMCLEVMKLFSQSNISNEDLEKGKYPDLFLKYIEAIKDKRRTSLRDSLGLDLTMNTHATANGWVYSCSAQLNKEAEYDGKINTAVYKSTEWLVGVYKNLSQIGNGAKAPSSSKETSGKK